MSMQIVIQTALLVLISLPSLGVSVQPPYTQTQEPRVIKAIPAIYPLFAALANESGVVVIDVEIKSDGTVADANVVDGHQLFRGPAQRSAQNWVFNSADDRTLSRTARLTFSFQFIPRARATPEELLPVFMPPYAVEIKGTTPDDTLHPNVDPSNRTKPNRAKGRP